MKKYDFLMVGSGLFASVFAYYATKQGKRCLVVEKRDHIGGNIYCENVEDILVHKYGAHIFHTSNKKVWNFVNQFVEFNRYINSPIANYKGEIFNLPFNMNTFHQLWSVITPKQALEIIEKQRAEVHKEPENLEEQALKLVGRDIYEKLIKGYTEKQWGRDCKELPSFIIKRLPLRFIYDNNYFNDTYQGIPVGGYNPLIEQLLEGCDVELNTDYLADKARLDQMADAVVYTGTIDAYFQYQFGELSYRSLRFESETLAMPNYQGNAVVNYTEREIPYTRIIEHKHFAFGQQDHTVITREYPADWKQGLEPYYPVNDETNQTLFQKYENLAKNEKHVIFGGRLAEYKYYDMDKVIESAMNCAEKVFGRREGR